MEALDLRVPFDEKAVLEVNTNYLVRSLEVCTLNQITVHGVVV